MPGDREQPVPTAPDHEPSWLDAVRVQAYLERHSQPDHPRAAGDAAVATELGRLAHPPTSALDLGCGDGRLSAVALEACPSLTRVVAGDVSPPMLVRAEERFAGEPRVSVITLDLNQPLSEAVSETFDLVLSCFAIHHLEDDRKQALFREIHDVLASGGSFVHLEVVASATPALHAEFLAAIGRPTDDPEDRLVDLPTQLRWLYDLGFDNVSSPWQWKGYALMVAQR